MSVLQHTEKRRIRINPRVAKVLLSILDGIEIMLAEWVIFTIMLASVAELTSAILVNLGFIYPGRKITLTAKGEVVRFIVAYVLLIALYRFFASKANLS